MRRADPHRGLIRALLTQYPMLRVVGSEAKPWASATFSGARHRVTCTAAEPLSGIEEAELPLPGHIVADLIVSHEGDQLLIEALTVEVD